MKRALIIYQHLPHYRRDIFSLLDSTEELEVVFLASDRGQDGIAVMGEGDVHSFKRARCYWVGSLMVQPRALWEVTRHRYDFVIALGDPHYVSTWLLALVCRLQRVPIAFWTHGWTRHQTGLRTHVKNLFFRLPNHLLLYNDRAVQIGVRHGFARSAMTAIYNGVPSDRPADAEISVQVASDIEVFTSAVSGPHIGAVIRLRDEKRLELLIEAVARLRQQKDGFENLAIILGGDGPARESLDHLSARLKVPVLFLGPVYDSGGLHAIYRALALTVVPDKVGLTGIQSLKYGVPVVTHSDMDRQMPEVEAIEDGVTGFLYTEGSLQSLTDAIHRGLVAVSADSIRFADQCAQAVADKWNPNSQLDRILTAINSLTRS